MEGRYLADPIFAAHHATYCNHASSQQDQTAGLRNRGHRSGSKFPACGMTYAKLVAVGDIKAELYGSSICHLSVVKRALHLAAEGICPCSLSAVARRIEGSHPGYRARKCAREERSGGQTASAIAFEQNRAAGSKCAGYAEIASAERTRHEL